MLAAILSRFLLTLIDLVTMPFRVLIALLPGQRFEFRWLSRRVDVEQQGALADQGRATAE